MKSEFTQSDPVAERHKMGYLKNSGKNKARSKRRETRLKVKSTRYPKLGCGAGHYPCPLGSSNCKGRKGYRGWTPGTWHRKAVFCTRYSAQTQQA